MDKLEMYTLKEVEDILKVSQRSLYRYIKSGQLKAVKFGKAWRVSREDLEAFLKAGTK